MVPNVVEKQKVTKDDTLVYDKLFFEPDIFNPSRVIYKQGDLITVGLAEIPETFEDSAAISTRLNTTLGTTVTKIKSIILEATDNVFDVKSVGDHLEPTDSIMSMTKAGIGESGLDERTRELLKSLKTSSPKAKMRGTISKIKVLYNCEFSELSKTLQEIAAKSDKIIKEETGWTGQIVNGSYSTRGRVLQKGEVEIKFYIDVNNGMGIGDKMILSNQLKCTIGSVWDETITTDDKTEIDCLFSLRAISARIVLSPLLIGTTSMVLEKLTEKALEEYFGK